MIRLQTSRLMLRPFQTADLPALEALLADPEVVRYLFQGLPLSRSETKNFVDSYFTPADDPIGMASLCEKDTEKVIGFAGPIPCEHLGEADYEFGCVLAQDTWGRGYGTEICRAQIEYGFDELSCTRLLALFHPDNMGSLNIVTKFEMTFVKQVEDRDRGPRNVYSLMRSAWEGGNAE